jgi:Glycosyltransferase family 87
MRRAVRENALCAFVAGAGCATMAWLGLYGFAWTDYEIEVRPAFEALAHGHVVAFLQLAPTYGGSLVERSPFAVLPGLWGGGELAVYRMVALPCLLASAVLAVWLVARMRSEGWSTLARAVTLGVCVANPLTLSALEIGHPEELLGACLCVAAVLLASRGRYVWAGALLGLAIANKQWALLAAGPVLLALPPRRMLRCLASAGAAAAVMLGPLVAVGSSGFVAGTRVLATAPAVIFQPWQVWWFLGAPNHVAALAGGGRTVPIGAPLSTHPEWRLAPPWLPGVTHPLIIAVGLGLAGALWLQRRRRTGAGAVGEHDALLALALVMLLRCLLDNWDVIYYLLPFVFALLAWEVRGPATRPPAIALSIAALAWVSFQWSPQHISPDAQAAFFLAWSLPLATLLSITLFGRGRALEKRELLGQAREPHRALIADQH